jgi:hypothetical protein
MVENNRRASFFGYKFRAADPVETALNNSTHGTFGYVIEPFGFGFPAIEPS